MENERNQTVFDVNVYFVIPSKYESNEDCKEEMWEAFNKCPDWDINPEWIAEQKCHKITPIKKDVFVLEDFKGLAFEKLQHYKCTIIGPHCLLSCFLTGEPIPEGSTPVYNTAMRGIIVCASGFSGEVKKEIQKQVEYMGGIFTKQLRTSVTHLVTDIVMSAKYERAIELKIKVMTVDWIKSVWDSNLQEYISANDFRFDKFKCPIFLNLVVTSTNLNKKLKDDVKRLIQMHGGEFMGALDGSKTKIVITEKENSSSDKIKYAMHHNIPCLKINWIYDSVDVGYSLPLADYVIQSTKACSTPEKHAAGETLNFSTISMIPVENPNSYVDETFASITTVGSNTINASIAVENPVAMSKVSYITVLDRLNVADAKRAGPFLDGCNIYLAGFSSSYRDKLNRILNVGSATRLDEISDALTHVIIGDSVKASNDLRIIKSKKLYPFILKIEWLEECMKLKAPALEEKFIFDGIDDRNQTLSELPSPLSKKNFQLLQKPKKIPPAPKFDDDDRDIKEPLNDEHSEIVQHYLQKANSDSNSFLKENLEPSNNYNPLKNLSVSEQWNNTTHKDCEVTSLGERDDSAIPISQECSISQKILQDLTFTVVGFEKDEHTQIVTQILGMGGKVVGENYSGIPDYGIVSQFGTELRSTVGDIVTNLFIEDCIDNEKLVEIEYYHNPITIPSNVKPLINCVIGMSTYSGSERTYLSILSEALGARYQDTFARKTNLQKNTYSNTHLVCPEPQGDKYRAAVKWGLPAVTAEWLIKCACEKKFVDENPYLVGETMVPQRDDTIVMSNETLVMRPPTGPSNELPANLDQLREKTAYTPTNKRLNDLINSKTPVSPFHIATPDTPYGQLFKENPSPRTRKAWLKYIDHYPDMQEQEPPPKRRKSTPFSEVKRMAWDFVTGRLDSQKDVPTVDKKNDIDVQLVKDKTANETESNHIATNRRLSFSDDNSPNTTPKNSTINFQIAQLNEMLQKASDTPDVRQSINSGHENPYHLEQRVPGTGLVKESQPDSVGWEDPVKRVPPSRLSIINQQSELEDTEEQDVQQENSPEASREYMQEIVKPKFMFSGIKDKSKVEKIIKELGGDVSTESTFDQSATHLLCLKPARNEKILGSIAAGKWVLHYLYIQASYDEKEFVNEEEYEMGNPKSKGIIPDPNNDNERMIMDAAHRWRLRLLKDPGGAFCHITALLITPQEKKEQYERLILAGNGTVVEAKPPYESSIDGKKITHCFIQLKQIDQQVEWAMMASKGIMCFPPQYLNDCLMEKNVINPRDCVLPEFQKYLALMPK